jgi:sugar lactone lactonase YvrE
LFFQWSQTAGPDVTLSDETSDSPSFTAPDEDTTVTFELMVDDGFGGSDSDSVDIVIEAATVPQLYIANFFGNSVTSYEYPTTVNGDIPPTTNLTGADTDLNFPADIVVNASDQLLASNYVGQSITTYNGASTATGNQMRDGLLTPAAFGGPASLAITSSDELLVADYVNSEIYTFVDTSSTLNGNTPPTRTLQSADLLNPTGINFGANGDLYVANFGNNEVLVFSPATTGNFNGTFGATRTINSAAFGGVFDVNIDQDSDTMFVVDHVNGQIHTFENASTLQGAENPQFTLTVTPAVNITAIAVDSAGTGYIVDTSGGPLGMGAVYTYDNIATLQGNLQPDATITGGQTQMDYPIRVFLAE